LNGKTERLRDQTTTDVFIEGLRDATARTPFQITTDGFAPYKSAIPTTLHDRLTGYAMLIKVYRASQDGEARYSPAEVKSVEVVSVYGQPDSERICTSIVERSNLSIRMGVRRFTRLTNAFSKKWENHAAIVMLCFAYLQFLPHPQIAARHACHGSRDQRSRVGTRGIAGVG
jgi:hypothetical protein